MKRPPVRSENRLQRRGQTRRGRREDKSMQRVAKSCKELMQVLRVPMNAIYTYPFTDLWSIVPTSIEIDLARFVSRDPFQSGNIICGALARSLDEHRVTDREALASKDKGLRQKDIPLHR